jgi:uncharacterized damage-inducible protein DinB
MNDDICPVLSRTPAIVRALFEGAPADALEFHEAAGAWSAKQVLCHLAEAEITDWMPRINIILGSSRNRRFTPFDREGGFVRFAGWDARQLLDEFERLRQDNVTKLQGLALTEPDLDRTGIHPEFGPVTLSQLLACWATHDLAHINQITRSLVRHRGPTIGPWTRYYRLLADY